MEDFCSTCGPEPYTATGDPSSLRKTCFLKGWCKSVDTPGDTRLMLWTNQTVPFGSVFPDLMLLPTRQAFDPLSIGNKGDQ